jgi:O-acetylhomoserine (thiol)-lyase
MTGANVPFSVRARVCLLRDLGSACPPDNAFAIIQGLETVALRMKQHCDNAHKAVNFLKKHKEVTKVIYSTEHDKHISDRAKQYLKGGNGPMVGIELKGGIEAGKRFIESLKMFYHVANIGDARSLAIHPASTTHSQLNDKELAASGVTQSYVRLCIGIEHIDDIIDGIYKILNKTPSLNFKKKFRNDSLSPVAPFCISNIQNPKRCYR